MTNTWPVEPVVSGLLVLMHQDLRDFAQRSIYAFDAQTWPNKELVVVNATQTKLVLPSVAREFRLKLRHRGEALNVALYNAEGTHCFYWSEDSVYSPGYVRSHMAVGCGRATAWRTPRGRIVTYEDGAVGPLADVDAVSAPFYSFPRLTPFNYAPDGSAAAFYSQFADLVWLEDEPGLMGTARLFADHG